MRLWNTLEHWPDPFSRTVILRTCPLAGGKFIEQIIPHWAFWGTASQIFCCVPFYFLLVSFKIPHIWSVRENVLEVEGFQKKTPCVMFVVRGGTLSLCCFRLDNWHRLAVWWLAFVTDTESCLPDIHCFLLLPESWFCSEQQCFQQEAMIHVALKQGQQTFRQIFFFFNLGFVGQDITFIQYTCHEIFSWLFFFPTI